MTNPVESLLEDDHHSLSDLLAELDGELDGEIAKSNVSRAFRLLDLFWARLAVHIRAENLHLFPALAGVSSLVEGGGEPTSDGIQLASVDVGKILSQLRSDHDFFMKELADMIKLMREMAGRDSSHVAEIADLRRRLMVIKERLDQHNKLEEEQVYLWPALVLDEQTMDRLRESLRKELSNIPPRFS